MQRALGRRLNGVLRGAGILPLGMWIFSACVPFVSQRLDPLDSQTEVVLIEETRRTALPSLSWQEGMKAFEDGNYSKAKDVFETLAAETGSEDLRRKARYAVACAQLALARDPETFRRAMASWEQWRQTMPKEMFPEDPRMLAPFLQRVPPPAKPGPPPVQRPKPEVSSEFKKMLETKEDEIRLRQEEIRSREEEIRSREQDIRRLKEQLDALEAIHRQIEEKKKGATSP